jgi:D-serine deaminase-like pyridoxal phosphate-dependent protein
MVVEFPEARISRLSEEHGEIEFQENQPAPVVGTRLTIIPNHICVCVNLQNSFQWYENGVFTEYCVDARGMVN